MYALNLGENGRILSATYPQYAPPTQPRVEALPEGDIYEYRYVAGEYIHDPLPVEEVVPAPTIDERVDDLETALAQTDETAIELYEAMAAQEEINEAQDEALIDLYELIGG